MENGNGITKAELNAALTEMRTLMVDELTGKIQATKGSLMEEMRQIETNLLTEFHRYGKGQQLRLHSLETRDAGLTERLAVIEERLLHLETRRPPSI
jgi:hypothetical protein